MKRETSIRRIIALAAAGILAVSLMACGGSGSSSASGSTAESTEADPAGNAESTEAPAAENSAASGDLLPYQTVEYLQGETVLADNDSYKLTLTGYDPTWSEGDDKGFKVSLKVENKSDSEYSYMITPYDMSVNRQPTVYMGPEIVLQAGDSGTLFLVIPEADLEKYGISSVDEVSFRLQAMRSDFDQSTFDPEKNDGSLIQDIYTVSPTGNELPDVPQIALADNADYEVIFDNEILTLSVSKDPEKDFTFIAENKTDLPIECVLQKFVVDGVEQSSSVISGIEIPAGAIADDHGLTAIELTQFGDVQDLWAASEISFLLLVQNDDEDHDILINETVTYKR